MHTIRQKLKSIIQENLTNSGYNDIEQRKKKASEFIKKYGVFSSPDLRYITHPLYGYLDYKYIDKIKELGVKYKFLPLKEINLNGALEYRLKEDGFGSVLIQNNYLRFFSTPDNMDIEYIKQFKNKVEDSITKFNNLLGTDFKIVKIFAEQTSDSLRRTLTTKLKGEESNQKKVYKSVSFKLERGNEEEFLAQIPMEDINNPVIL